MLEKIKMHEKEIKKEMQRVHQFSLWQNFFNFGKQLRSCNWNGI